MYPLLIRSAIRASWPALAVFVLHAVLGSLFGHEPIVDPFAHFAGGCAIAYLVIILVATLPTVFGRPSQWSCLLIAVGMATVAALAWELGELGSDLLFGTNIQDDAHNTLRDLALGLFGGLLLAIRMRRHFRPTLN